MNNRALALPVLFTLVCCGGAAVQPTPDAGPPADSGPVTTTDAGAADAAPDAAPAAPLADMNVPRSLFGVVSGKDGVVHVFNGLSLVGLQSTTEAYDATKNEWTPGGAAASVERYAGSAVEDADGDILVVGGTTDGQNPTGSVERYAPSKDAWSKLADLPTPRLGLATARAKDGRVFAIGGRAMDGKPSSVVEVWSPSTKTWSAGPSLPTPRLSLQAVAGADGLIYAIGGRDAQQTPLAVVEVLDPNTNQWTQAVPLGVARYWFGATLGADNRIYVTGGIGGPKSEFLDSAEAFAPNQGWTKLAPMPKPRAWGGAAAAKDGRVFMIGGSIPAGGLQPPPVASMVAYDPKANAWSE